MPTQRETSKQLFDKYSTFKDGSSWHTWKMAFDMGFNEGLISSKKAETTEVRSEAMAASKKLLEALQFCIDVLPHGGTKEHAISVVNEALGEAEAKQEGNERFDIGEWIFERISGYEGYRSLFTNEWIYAEEYSKRRSQAKQPEPLIFTHGENCKSLLNACPACLNEWNEFSKNNISAEQLRERLNK